ncbi:hypothetical protein, partial [Micromonospora sp. NPDC049033]
MAPNTVNLRCQTIIDGQLGYVLLPVTRHLWETSEDAREDARRRARDELRHRAVKQTGRDLPAADFDTLPVWAEYPDRCEVECVGGPADGKRITLASAEPPPAINIPLEESLLDLLTAHTPPESALNMVTYVPLRGAGGFLSRAADGAWR